MKLVYIPLMTIGAMLLVALMALPLIVLLNGYYAWKAIPREIYARERQRLLGLPPIYLWIAWAILDRTSELFKWLHSPVAQNATEGVSLVLLFLVLISHLVWAFRILRAGLSMDARLLRFARYAFWGPAVGILAVASSLVSFLTT